MAVVIVVVVILWTYCYYYLQAIPFGRKWNGEIVAILGNGQIVPLEKAGYDFHKFFLPGATKVGKEASLFVKRYVLGNGGVGWKPESDMGYIPRQCHLEVQQDGVVATFWDGSRDGIVGYRLKITSQYPFKGSKLKYKQFVDDTPFYEATYCVAIK